MDQMLEMFTSTLKLLDFSSDFSRSWTVFQVFHAVGFMPSIIETAGQTTTHG